MPFLIIKETLNLLKNYTVLVPYNSIPIALNKSVNVEYLQSIYRLIPNPLCTHNEKYYFISSMNTKKDNETYNNIASEIRKRDMFGDVIIYDKNYNNITSEIRKRDMLRCYYT